MFRTLKKTAIVVLTLSLLTVGWFLLGRPITTHQFENIVSPRNEAKPSADVAQSPFPCLMGGAAVASPFGADALTSNGCNTTPDAVVANTQPPVPLAPTDSNYQLSIKLRKAKMVEGLENREVVAAADTVFAAKYCAGLKPADQVNNACSESDLSRKQALTILKSASDKGDVEASFAFARALSLDNSSASGQQAIGILEAIPEKSKETAAFLEYLQHR